MKKLWQIAGTGEFHENKQDLKKVRKQLNQDSGIDESDAEVKTASWKFKITKGPDHRNYE